MISDGQGHRLSFYLFRHTGNVLIETCSLLRYQIKYHYLDKCFYFVVFLKPYLVKAMYHICCNKHPCPIGNQKETTTVKIQQHLSPSGSQETKFPQLIELIFLNMPVFKSNFHHV